MPGETIGIGESIQATVVKATPEFDIFPIIILLSFIFFMFLCYKAWNKKRRNSVL